MGWALVRARGPTGTIKVNGKNGHEMAWQVNALSGQVTKQSRTGGAQEGNPHAIGGGRGAFPLVRTQGKRAGTMEGPMASAA